ncbi:metal-dependent transcriptional regulator [Propioniciclava sp.]|uniref:metal-dependent transcriptional regulator n=1 Tax=Propioniciclava sp. TaxID=2038686 RepID=UPI00260DF924|nr:metal-dependent transcriptional regulator [Propioniciclava sp.]
MSELIDTTEMYLRTVYELEEEGIPPLRARIAERLSQSGPTVSQTVQRMERDGLLVVGDDRRIHLTDAGRLKATSVMRKHRLAEVLLTDVIGLDWELVHDEACRWEHVISDAVEDRLVALLADPHVSPYGNPIPARDAAGPPALPAEGGVVLLAEALGGKGAATVAIARLTEELQADPDLIAALAEAGVRPGVAVAAELAGDRLRLAASGRVTVDAGVTQMIFVRTP